MEREHNYCCCGSGFVPGGPCKCWRGALGNDPLWPCGWDEPLLRCRRKEAAIVTGYWNLLGLIMSAVLNAGCRQGRFPACELCWNLNCGKTALFKPGSPARAQKVAANYAGG